VIEAAVRRKLTEGADVTANSMKPLAAAAAKLANTASAVNEAGGEVVEASSS